MDDFDEYEQFYEDLFDRQRESFGEYDDFLDDLKELQRGGLDGGNEIADAITGDGANTFRNSNLLNYDGSFADDLLESRYQEYIRRNTSAGKPVRDRLNWKEASDSFAAIKEQGRMFELEKLEEFKKVATDVEDQITIITNDGTKIRVDAIGYDKDTKALIIQEYKSSATAPPTDNQRIGFQQLEKNGGIIVGEGKGLFYGGVEMPAGTEVQIIRPD